MVLSSCCDVVGFLRCDVVCSLRRVVRSFRYDFVRSLRSDAGREVEACEGFLHARGRGVRREVGIMVTERMSRRLMRRGGSEFEGRRVRVETIFPMLPGAVFDLPWRAHPLAFELGILRPLHSHPRIRLRWRPLAAKLHIPRILTLGLGLARQKSAGWRERHAVSRSRICSRRGQIPPRT
jgi:hypothetical protein